MPSNLGNFPETKNCKIAFTWQLLVTTMKFQFFAVTITSFRDLFPGTGIIVLYCSLNCFEEFLYQESWIVFCCCNIVICVQFFHLLCPVVHITWLIYLNWKCEYDSYFIIFIKNKIYFCIMTRSLSFFKILCVMIFINNLKMMTFIYRSKKNYSR